MFVMEFGYVYKYSGCLSIHKLTYVRQTLEFGTFGVRMGPSEEKVLGHASDLETDDESHFAISSRNATSKNFFGHRFRELLQRNITFEL